jgi:hypothetical protein
MASHAGKLGIYIYISIEQRDASHTSASDTGFLERRMSLVGLMTSTVKGMTAARRIAEAALSLRVGPRSLYASQAEDAEPMAAREACAQIEESHHPAQYAVPYKQAYHSKIGLANLIADNVHL